MELKKQPQRIHHVSSHITNGLIKKNKGTFAGDIFSELAKEESSHKKHLEKKITELQADLEALKEKSRKKKNYCATSYWVIRARVLIVDDDLLFSTLGTF